jgi:hypothetical protein
MAGLFLLGMASRAGNPAAAAGVAAGSAIMLWLTLPKLAPDTQSLVHASVIPVAGTAAVLVVGSLVSRLTKSRIR